jgi:GAF domain-containing protein
VPLAIPVKVRGSVIGVIDTAKPAESGQWTPEEIVLAETLADQLGTALESARLYQDTQRRAAREQLTREITDNIRSAVSVEDALQRAIRELGRALGAEMVARIGTEDELLPTERKQA